MAARARARLHPDRGGDGGLFAWAQEVRQRVEGQRCSTCPADFTRREKYKHTREDRAEPARIPFLAVGEEFDAITLHALALARELPEPYAGVLRLLAGCYAEDHGRAWAAQQHAHHIGAARHRAGARTAQPGLVVGGAAS